MSLFSAFERRSNVPDTETRGWAPITGTTGLTTAVDAEGALGVSAVHFCVSMIADTIATLPVDVYRKKDGKREPVDNPTWTTRPNPNELWVDFMQKVMTSLLFDGNAFILTVRDNKNVVKQMYVLHPSDVEVKASDNKRVYIYDKKRLDDNQIVHISGTLLPNSLRGISPLESMRLSLDYAQTAEKFGRDNLRDGIQMSGVIELPGNANAEETKRLGEQFSSRHAAGKTAVGVLSGGATWKPITITPEQAQFIESRRFNKTDIAQFYKIPAYMVDPTVTSTWGSGIAEQNLMFLTHVLNPYIIKIEQAFSTIVLAGQQYFKFNTRALSRGRSEQEMELLVKGTNNGLMTINEARGLLDLEPIEGGNEMMLPLNISPISHQERKLEIQEKKAEADANAVDGGNNIDQQN